MYPTNFRRIHTYITLPAARWWRVGGLFSLLLLLLLTLSPALSPAQAQSTTIPTDTLPTGPDLPPSS